MPSKSPAQARLMAAVAHGMKPKGKGPSVAVAKEFNEADTGTPLLKRANAQAKALRAPKPKEAY